MLIIIVLLILELPVKIYFIYYSMKELFLGSLVTSYSDFLEGNIISNVIVNIENNMAKEIITGEKFSIITISDKGYGVCNLVNITNNRKVLQVIANYLVEHRDFDEFNKLLNLVREQKELPKLKRR